MRLVAPLLLAVLLLPGCGSEDAGTPGQKTIGVTLLSQSQDFYKDLEEGMRSLIEWRNAHQVALHQRQLSLGGIAAQ